jgi:hypothetical protein
MTLAQALRALNLPAHPGAVMASGPPGSYGYHIQMETNRGAVLRFDLRKEPAAFVKAQLFGDGWKEQQQ